MEAANEKELLREQFELISANLKAIVNKRKDRITPYDRQFLLNAIKKVIFVKNSFDIKSPKFGHLFKGIGIATHTKNSIVFEKGDEGHHFYIVLDGVYCVEVDNIKEGKKERQIYYFPGDSFGEVSLIYDVPRGTRIVADQNSSLLTIEKEVFNECGDLRKNILYLNNYFKNHPFFENESNFMIRVISSLSKLSKFNENETIVDEGNIFHEILFFVKGEAKVFKTLSFENEKGKFTETIEIQSLVEGNVYGEHFYATKQPSTIRIIGGTRGEFIRVHFKDDVHTVENDLYKRIRQNALRFPTDQQLFDQFKIYLEQKYRQLQYINTIYVNDKQKKKQLLEAKKKLIKIACSKLIERSY